MSLAGREFLKVCHTFELARTLEELSTVMIHLHCLLGKLVFMRLHDSLPRCILETWLVNS